MNPDFLNRKRFFLHIVLPSLLAVGLFVILIFGIIIPYFEYHLLNGKKEMIRELVNSAVSMAERYEKDVAEGLITREEAQSRAIRRISHLRYGIGYKDYFWITDMRPVMIAHPYRGDLNGQDLSSFTDPSGKKLFVASVETVKESGEGFIDYQWQWMDDSSLIVPKISFVKIVKPWDWIIGTGVYIEDIRAEISGIRQKLVFTLLGICLIISLLLFYIARQSLKTEVKRLEAEQLLRESREKYRSLIEASTEGAFMILDGRCVYGNPAIRSMISLSQGDPVSNDLREIIDPGQTSDRESVTKWFESESLFLNIETQLKTPDGRIQEAVLYLSKITLSSQRGMIVIARDVSAEPAFRTLPVRETWLSLSESFGIGFFRSIAGRRGKLTDANETAVRLFGFKNKDELIKRNILDLITDPSERKRLIQTLERENIVVNYPVRITTQDQTSRDIALTAVVYRDLERQTGVVDGIVRDITEQTERDLQRDDLIVRSRIPHDLIHQPVSRIMKEPVRCSYLLTVTDAAAYFSANETDFMIVTSSSGEGIGYLTDREFRTFLSRRFLNPAQPVFEIMRSPVIMINDDDTIALALMLMMNSGVSHLAIKDRGGAIIGMADFRSLSGLLFQTLQADTSYSLEPTTMNDIRARHGQIRKLTGLMAINRAPVFHTTEFYSRFADDTTRRLIEQITRDMGVAPAPFVLIALGSEGRSEQTLMTDQDNALIYCPGDDSDSDFINHYFLQFGSRLNRMLDDAGYHLCKGDVMARNPKWCQPLSVWKSYFNDWIQTPEPQAILDISTFFDLRSVYGDDRIVNELIEFIEMKLGEHPAFFSHLASACMNYKIPIGLFNKIRTETDSGNTDIINIKSPIRVIVHIIRLYAMNHRIRETNTLLRMKRLFDLNVFSQSAYREWKESYEFLLQLQLRHQADVMELKQVLTPYIALSDLTGVETDTMISVFNRIALFQSALGRDFSIPK